MNKKALILTLGLLVLSVAGFLITGPDATPPQVISAASITPPVKSGDLPAQIYADGLLQAAAKADPSARKAPSLEGTDVDGGFRVDDNGNLLIDISIRRYIDYYLTTVGEASVEEITASIRHTLESRLPEPARSQALEILRQYLGYKTALQALQQEEGASQPLAGESAFEVLEGRLQKLRDARDTYLAPELAEAFFGPENQLDQYTLEKLRVQQDASLSAEEKLARVAALQERLPENMREQIQETSRFENWQAQEEALLARQAGADEIYQLRAQTFGAQAAERLAELDRQRERWDRRFAVYSQEKRQLDQAGLAEQDYQSQLTELRSRHFDEIERRRVAALDKLAAASR